MKIEILYIEGCPSYQECHETINKILAKEGIDAEVELRLVKGFSEAEEFKFVGSPTIRINGKDIDPDGARKGQYGIESRAYRYRDKMLPMPPEPMLRKAIKDAAK